MLKHVALEVKENDIQSFYVNILGGTISEQFTLSKEEANEIFKIPKDLEIYKLKLVNLHTKNQDLELELFVHETIEHDCLQHVCLQVENASNVFQKANKEHFWTHLRKSNKKETYFIKDHNDNMFEISN